MFLVGCCNKPDQQDKYILTEFAFVYTKYIYIRIYIYTHTHVRIQKHTDTKSKSICLLLSLCVRHKSLEKLLLSRDKSCQVLSTRQMRACRRFLRVGPYREFSGESA